MRRVIWKYPLPFPPTDIFDLPMPLGAQFLRVEVQFGVPCLWALVDSDAPTEAHRFAVVGTGHPCPPEGYIGSFHLQDGTFVGHLFSEHSDGDRG